MRQAIGETDRRRALQEQYNIEHNITPATIKRAIFDMNPASGTTDYYAVPRKRADGTEVQTDAVSDADLAERIQALRQEMFAAAENLQFETAARLRDELKKLQALDPEATARANKVSGSDRPPARRSDRPPAKRSDRPPSFKGRAAGRRR
jgi:excinuclease ABC subunit B